MTELKWPEKIKYFYSKKQYPDNCVEAANKMHDAFMKVIEARKIEKDLSVHG